MIKNILLYLSLFVTIIGNAQSADFENVDFREADKAAISLYGNDLKSLPILAYNLTHSLPSDVEKFRAIFMWVSTNIENDYNYYLKNTKERNRLKKDSIALNNWNKKFSVKVFKKLLKEKKTVCTGYAYLIKELSDLSNIKCEMIDGYGRTVNDNNKDSFVPNHSWNAVWLNNKWYLCDATWASGVFDLDKYVFEFNYNDGYFLSNPEMFATNHFPLDSKWLLTEKENKLSEFLKAPFVYRDAFKHEIMPLEPSVMFFEVDQYDEVFFLLKERVPIDVGVISLELVSGSYNESSKPSVIRNEDGFIELKYLFNVRGDYDIHIKLNEDYLFTYVVKVKREKK
ncbi:MAG: hypothetical protein ACI9FW_000938 [Flavobacterium sp.]|jgi:hypothetical protein